MLGAQYRRLRSGGALSAEHTQSNASARSSHPYRLLVERLSLDPFRFLPALDGAISGGPASSGAAPAWWADAAMTSPA